MQHWSIYESKSVNCISWVVLALLFLLSSSKPISGFPLGTIRLELMSPALRRFSTAWLPLVLFRASGFRGPSESKESRPSRSATFSDPTPLMMSPPPLVWCEL
uniref:Putative secreted protein n=1 Tax=Amblyomma americanum TaxID=6943 RepID=A0A0C9SCW0_AMBAM